MRRLLLLLVPFIAVSCAKTPKFQLLGPKQTGIDFNNKIAETDSFNVMTYEYIYNGAGVGIGDLNNDGLQDIIFAGNKVSSRVYLNLGSFKFRDITANFEGLTDNQWYSGVTVADVNGDGWADVYLTSTADSVPAKCKNRLWINQGTANGKDPLFKELAEQYGIADEHQSVNAAFFDYDLDGDLDLYILNNTLTTRMNTAYHAKVTDGSAPNNDRLYRNNGDGTFTDVTIQAGIVYEGYGLGLLIGDVNKDGYPDIYVSNDYMSNDLLYINQRDGTFRNEIAKYMSYQTKSSMGDDMADINNDGNPDIITLDMLPEEYYKKKQTINGFAYTFYINDNKFGYEHQYLRNMLHMHNGFLNGEMLPFSEVGQMLGIYQTEWSWSPLFADYDNDGDKDLIVANGYPKDMTDKDWTKYKVKVFGFLADEQHVIDMAPAIKVPNMAFENTGNLSFRKRSDWLPDVPSYSYGAAFVDLDNDGDLDYVANNLDDNAFILKNNTVEKSGMKANFIKIILRGNAPNTMAVGAKVELWENGRYQFMEHFMTRGYASSVDPVIHFGLSGDKIIDSILVTWPLNKSRSVVKNINAGQTITIDEKDSSPCVPVLKQDEGKRLLFTRADSMLDYTHDQNDFVDFFLRQNIIPHKFSQIGPAIAKGDIDGDGRQDLVIGSTDKQPTSVYLWKGRAFKKTEIPGLTEMKEFTESDLAVVDIDGDGDKDVIAVAGGYENQKESDYRHLIYLNNNGSFIAEEIPVPPFPASVVRSFDFNHDGNMEFFIGSRVKLGKFPYADPSWLVLNDKGRLSVNGSSKLDIGMVTDAVWTDYDRDGWEDLLVVREWNSPMLLKNMNGKELIPRKIPELEAYHGLWYSIIATDFDGDGYDDYIVGNLGDNTRFSVSDKYPLNLYAVDLDLDGVIDPLSTGYWKNKDGKMTEYPINYLDELWAQSTFFRKKFEDYATFSYAGVKDFLDADILKRIDFKLHVNTTSSYIIWNDKGKFKWEKLPRSVQVSPVTRMIVNDFNGDGHPDALLAGNDYTFDIATGYYDANKGIVLLNKGKDRAFEVLMPSESGILLQGMVQGLQYLKGDTSFVIAGMNRGRAVVYRQDLFKSK